MQEVLKNVHFYMESVVHTWLCESFKSLSYQEGVNYTMELIDQPFTCVTSHSEGYIEIKLYIRSEVGAFLENPDLAVRFAAKGGDTKVTANTGRLGGDAGQTLGVFLQAAASLFGYLAEQDMTGDFSKLNAEKEGVVLTLDNEKLTFTTVQGKKRPDLACAALFGGIQMGRPYQDELMASWMDDMMPFEEKLAAAEEGNEEMMEQVAMAYLNGEEVEQSPEKATAWFRKLAELGHSNAQFNMGLHCAKGHGTPRSFTEALYWMQMAADNGDTDAPAIIERLEKAVAAEKKIDSGDPQAEADLAAFYMFMGNSLDQADPEKDYTIALTFAQSAAAQNNGDGIWALALAYEHGRGVEANVERAIELYRKGAELGHAPSQHSLACYYFRGDVVEADHDLAFELCMKSALQGYGLAMKDVGRCYQFGNGVEDDMDLAIEWYEKALEVIADPELERKVQVFKMLQQNGGFGGTEE